MSISFNHPSNTMTSTGSLNLIVNGGNPTSPMPIRFNSTSVVMPVRALPSGESGAMVFDNGTKTMIMEEIRVVSQYKLRNKVLHFYKILLNAFD